MSVEPEDDIRERQDSRRVGVSASDPQNRLARDIASALHCWLWRVRASRSLLIVQNEIGGAYGIVGIYYDLVIVQLCTNLTQDLRMSEAD